MGRLLVRFVKSEDTWRTIGRVLLNIFKSVRSGALYSPLFWWAIGGILVFMIGIIIGQHHEND